MNQSSATDSITQPASKPSSTPSTKYAYFVLGLLTLINLLNYIDRQIVAAVNTDIQADLGLTDGQFGYVLSILIISYTLLSPLFGRLGDRGERRKLIAIGITIWSIATALAGLAGSYHQLLLARSLIGIGEASYATIAPSLISDVFPKARRGTALGIFFAALPLGYALGFILGGLAPHFDQYFGPHRGWRPTMFIVGGPGLLMAAIVYFFMREPVRGALDDKADAGDEVDEKTLMESAPRSLVNLQLRFEAWLARLPARFRNSAIGRYLIDRLSIYASSLALYAAILTIATFLFATLGYTALTFGFGALGDWSPKLLETDKGMSPENARKVLGIIVLISGFLGTFLGGAISDWLLKYTKRSYFWVCGVTVMLGAIPTFISIHAVEPKVYIGCIFAAVMLLFMSNAPVNAIIVNAVAPNLRASAVALNILFIHIFGDAISRVAVGTLSDKIGDQAAHNDLPGFIGAIAHAFQLNPTTQHLSIALLITPVAMIIAGVFFLIGMKTIRV